MDALPKFESLPSPMTKPAHICLSELMRLVYFLKWVDPHLVNRRKLALVEPHQDPYDILIAEIILPRTIDLFLTYITDLITLVCRTNPRTLASKSTFTVEEILEYDTMDELLEAIIDKRVTGLAYSGMNKLLSEINTRWGFDLFPDEKS